MPRRLAQEEIPRLLHQRESRVARGGDRIVRATWVRVFSCVSQLCLPRCLCLSRALTAQRLSRTPEYVVEPKESFPLSSSGNWFSRLMNVSPRGGLTMRRHVGWWGSTYVRRRGGSSRVIMNHQART
jgi:hypothetical protein